MKEWLDTGIHQVSALLQEDADFQYLESQLETAQTYYREVIAAISEQHRGWIENYIALCEEVEYRKTVTAYYC